MNRDAQAVPSSLDMIAGKIIIMEQLARFCAIVDTVDLDRLAQVFCEDLTWDFNGVDLVTGLGALKARIRRTLGSNPNHGRSMHNISNVIASINGDAAESMANCHAGHEGAGAFSGQTYFAWITYNDHWTKAEGRWRIARRIYRTQFSHGPREIVYGTKKE